MSKKTVYLFATIGGFIGSYLPVLIFHDNNMFSAWSIFGGLVGGLGGVWVAYKVGQMY